MTTQRAPIITYRAREKEVKARTAHFIHKQSTPTFDLNQHKPKNRPEPIKQAAPLTPDSRGGRARTSRSTTGAIPRDKNEV